MGIWTIDIRTIVMNELHTQSVRGALDILFCQGRLVLSGFK